MYPKYIKMYPQTTKQVYMILYYYQIVQNIVFATSRDWGTFSFRDIRSSLKPGG